MPAKSMHLSLHLDANLHCVDPGRAHRAGSTRERCSPSDHKEAGGRVALVPPAARALAPGPEEVPRATCSTLAVLARIWACKIEL